jgi:hypothetical protein
MSDELSAMFHAAATEEATAAAREHPLAPAELDRFVGRVRRRRATRVTMLAVGGVVIVGALAFGLGHMGNANTVPPAASPSPSPSVSPSPAVSPSPSSSPSPSPEPSVVSPSPTETTPPPPAVPGRVTVVTGLTGGGSGEAMVDWGTLPNATGYRVYRSASPDGPFARAASISVATEEVTIEISVPYEYIQIWSPSGDSYEYIEVVDGQRAYFQIAAFNAGGSGPRSAVVCAAPPGATETC